MLELPRVNKKESSRHQIAIKGVDDGILILPNGHYRLIVETSSVNFDLMSEAEQDVIIDIYGAFLNSLLFPIQISYKVRALDIDDYLERFNQKKDREISDVYRDQITNYIEYVRTLVEVNGILSRRFFIVLPYDCKKTESINEVRNILLDRYSIVEKGLNNIGIKSRILNSLEVLDLFYCSYNLEESKRQPLKNITLELLQRNSF